MIWFNEFLLIKTAVITSVNFSSVIPINMSLPFIA